MVLVMGRVGSGWLPLREVPDTALFGVFADDWKQSDAGVEEYEVWRRKKEDWAFDKDEQLTAKMNGSLERKSVKCKG